VTRATTIHVTPGRVRLRIAGRRGDDAYFAQLHRELDALALVRSCRTNPRTGSVIIEHADTLDALHTAVAAAGLLEIAASDRSADVMVDLSRRVQDLDGALRSRTSGSVGLEAISFYALLAGAAVQLIRGPILPASATLLIQAAKMVADARPQSTRTT
jgi:hypothetical protein